jgi:4,5-dihydroxyphthalate decarboxylase
MPLLKPANITVNQTGKTLSQLLDEGELDAIIGTGLPDARRHNPAIRRLFPDFRAVEKDYYRRTGIFPIMHLTVIRREVYEQHPQIAQSLYEAFVQAKAVALERMRYQGALRYMLPWLPDDIEEIDEVFGGDPWPYGIEANRPTLEALVDNLYDQGVIPSRPAVDELFVTPHAHAAR